MEPLAFALGLVCIGAVFWDVFETILVPRPSPGRLRIARHLTRGTWRAWRALALRWRTGLARDRLLGMFAPALSIILLATWLVVLIVGYALILWAVRDQLRPVPADLGATIYFAGASVLTLGFGDVVAVGPVARFFSLMGAATGLGMVALVITYLFSLFGSYQRREILVVALEARAGAPPSAVALLEKYAKLGLADDLPRLFGEWERWSAEVLDSHVAYPLLGFFRSSHDDLSWISALGAVLDAASLVATTVCDVPRGPAYLMARVGSHLVEDISNFLGFAPEDGAAVDREAFEEVHDRLSQAGLRLEPVESAWPAFEAARSPYAGRLEAMAAYWATPATAWISRRGRSVSPAHTARSEAAGVGTGLRAEDRPSQPGGPGSGH